MDLEHPLMKYAMGKIQEYANQADETIDDIESAYTAGVFTFDFELLTETKELAQKALDNLNKYIEEQDERYEKLVKRLKVFRDFNEDDTVVMLWDFKRPIMYRVQRVNELIASIDRVFT